MYDVSRWVELAGSDGVSRWVELAGVYDVSRWVELAGSGRCYG